MDGDAINDYHEGRAPSKGLLRDCENFTDGSFAALLLVNHGLTVMYNIDVQETLSTSS